MAKVRALVDVLRWVDKETKDAKNYITLHNVKGQEVEVPDGEVDRLQQAGAISTSDEPATAGDGNPTSVPLTTAGDPLLDTAGSGVGAHYRSTLEVEQPAATPANASVEQAAGGSAGGADSADAGEGRGGNSPAS